MTSDDFEGCLMAIDRLESREQLLNINSASFAHSKENWRAKYHRELHRLANPDQMENVKQMSTEELALLLASRGGG